MGGEQEFDGRPRRANFTRSGSRETHHALVRAAATLWRTTGFAETTVADVCRAAGVSKGLFYFYFSRKEDLLHEIGVLSVEKAQADARRAMGAGFELEVVVDKVLAGMGRAMRRNPPALVLEAILEGYRREAQKTADGSRLIFIEAFGQAVQDGKLPPGTDTVLLARMAQSAVSEGARAWACGARHDKAFEAETGLQLRILIDGFRRRTERMHDRWCAPPAAPGTCRAS